MMILLQRKVLKFQGKRLSICFLSKCISTIKAKISQCRKVYSIIAGTEYQIIKFLSAVLEQMYLITFHD